MRIRINETARAVAISAGFFLLMLVMWGAGMPRRPATLRRIAAHAAGMLARPAVAATLSAEELPAPFV